MNRDFFRGFAAGCLVLGCVAFGWMSFGHEGHAHGKASVIDHDEVRTFENNGNKLRGIATLGTGAEQFEVWRSNVAVGSATPAHRHSSEEVFVFLRGKVRARIGDEEFEFEAPSTLVAPANVPHQYWNIGDVETDAIVIIGIGSQIWNQSDELMELPWRK